MFQLPVYSNFTHSSAHNLHYSQLLWIQIRWMTSSKRVQDRSKNKRVHDLEIVTEKHKLLSKILNFFEILKAEPENVLRLRNYDQHCNKTNPSRPPKVLDFIRKMPKLFELYKDEKGVVWCGMTKKAEELAKEEDEIIEKNSGKCAEFVTRMLMMAVDKRLPLDKIVHFRRDMGLPVDFRKHWVHQYPEYFKVVQPFMPHDESECLELVSWNANWAVTELEKTVLGENKGLDCIDHVPGVLSLPFPMKFPVTYKKVYRYGGKIDYFQKREYLSPYADARGLEAGSLEFDKRAVAIMHELLSFTTEKRLVTDHLTHFRREFVMPQKLMRLLLKHCGIFYVSERGKRFSVFLNEAYNGPELIEKHPLVVWKEKILSLAGYRGKKRKIARFDDDSDMEEGKNVFSSSDVEEQHGELELEQGPEIQCEENGSKIDGSEMEIEEVFRAYNDL